MTSSIHSSRTIATAFTVHLRVLTEVVHEAPRVILMSGRMSENAEQIVYGKDCGIGTVLET